MEPTKPVSNTHSANRGLRRSATAKHVEPPSEAADMPEPNDLSIEHKLDLLYQELLSIEFHMPEPFPGYTLVASISDGQARARVLHHSGTNLEDTWGSLRTRVLNDARKLGLAGKHLRIDWIENAEKCTWGKLRQKLTKTKRNYFRRGIALDEAFQRMFLEVEINANAMLYGGAQITHCVVNEKNFLIYAATKYKLSPDIEFDDDGEIVLFDTRGVYCDEFGEIHSLNEQGRNTGRRWARADSITTLNRLIKNASDFLSHQVQESGRFIYGYHPCFDREIRAYNALRHASTTYSMIEAWEVTRAPELMDAIERALVCLQTEFIKDVGGELSFVVDVGNEIKLGANATAILAFAKYTALTGDTKYADLMNRLAGGICHMQADGGAFVHVLNYPDLSVKEAFRIVYYEGEAAFSLMRLYDLTGNEKWLRTVELAFQNFIAKDYWRYHDHWLGYCVNELTKHRPKVEYFEFGIKNFADYLDFVLKRVTTFPTLLELMMAGQQMLERLREQTDARHLLQTVDLVKFERALQHRANYLLNGHFWPELAMFYKNPDRICGAFFIRHHAFRVRIDDVEHYLSGLIAYLGHVKKMNLPGATSPADMGTGDGATTTIAEGPTRRWNADHVVAATSGHWLTPPPKNWFANGVSIYAPTARPNDIVVLRGKDENTGVPTRRIETIGPPAAFIASKSTVETVLRVLKNDVPTLVVEDVEEAVLDMGRYARGQVSGTVVGVTGSSGKSSTVAMLAHVLEHWGAVAQSSHNANLPRGVAWNLASADWEAPFIVLELAVGRMALSAAIARPNISIFTNVQPAHLGRSHTLQDIARVKSGIFGSMSPDGVAIINRDMAEFHLVYDVARQHARRVIMYGEHPDSDIRLLAYDGEANSARLRVFGTEQTVAIGAAGRHMASNAMAVLAAISALGLPLEEGMTRLATFRAPPGRGAEYRIDFGGRQIHLLDDAYNANPGSMQAALQRLGDLVPTGRRIAVLGQMEELGPRAKQFHTDLLEPIRRAGIDRLYLLGANYEGLWNSLDPDRRGGHAASIDDLKSMLSAEIQQGDGILLKGSNSTGVHEVVRWMVEHG